MVDEELGVISAIIFKLIFVLNGIIGLVLIEYEQYLQSIEKGGLIALLCILSYILYRLYKKNQKEKDKLYNRIIEDKNKQIEDLKREVAQIKQ